MLVRPECPRDPLVRVAAADCGTVALPDSPLGSDGGLGAAAPSTLPSETPPPAAPPPPLAPTAATVSAGGVGGPPGGGGGGGGSPPPAALAAPPCIPAQPATAAWAAAAATPTTVSMVLPISPETTRFAMNGINRIMIERRMLESEMRSIWLAPWNAPPKLWAVKMLLRLFALIIV